MMESIEMFISAVPVAQPRHRQAFRGKDKKTGRAIITNYIPSEHPVHAWKKLVEVDLKLAFRQRGLLPINQPIGVDLVFVLPRPKSMTRKTKDNPRQWRDKKPDKDNLEKAVLDALSGVAWTDDAIVVTGETTKLMAGDGDQVGLAIRIRSLPEPTGWADHLFHVGGNQSNFFKV